MKHWTETDFQNWMYGLKEPDPHLEECADCRNEMTRLKLERGRIVTPPEVSNDFLAAQRRSIYQRLGQPMRWWAPLRWAVSAAMLAVLVIGFSLQHANKPAAVTSDDQLFSDLAAMEQRAEPAAAAPLHNLFEE